MTTTEHKLTSVLSREEDIKAEVQLAVFRALRKAWKHRTKEKDIKAKELAEALGKDKGYISRVLNGRVNKIDIETLALFLEALDYFIVLEAKPLESAVSTNFDMRPDNRNFTKRTDFINLIDNVKASNTQSFIFKHEDALV